MEQNDLHAVLSRIETRLTAIEGRLEGLSLTRHKSLEWIGQLSEQIGSLDAFREEVRASLEPLFGKLDTIDDVMRILRHATSDVSRRVEDLEVGRRRAG